MPMVCPGSAGGSAPGGRITFDTIQHYPPSENASFSIYLVPDGALGKSEQLTMPMVCPGSAGGSVPGGRITFDTIQHYPPSENALFSRITFDTM